MCKGNEKTRMIERPGWDDKMADERDCIRGQISRQVDDSKNAFTVYDTVRIRARFVMVA